MHWIKFGFGKCFYCGNDVTGEKTLIITRKLQFCKRCGEFQEERDYVWKNISKSKLLEQTE